jgi:hypothetical protein
MKKHYLTLTTALFFSGLFAGAALAGEEKAVIPAGDYECQVDSMYKFRPCKVELDGQGRSVLRVPEGGLLAFEGVVQKKDKWLLIEGSLTDARPFGCFICDERCEREPGSCACTELPKETSKECKKQTVLGLLKPSGKGKWTGSLTHRLYSNEYKDGKPTGVSSELNVYDLTIRAKK